jgi:hypothetical protein
MVGMPKPIYVALVLALPMEIVNDMVGLFAGGGNIKGPTVADMTPLKIILRGEVGIMHLPAAYVIPLITHTLITHPGVFEFVLLSALAMFFVSGYVDWVFLLTAILYGYRAAARYVREAPSS